MISMEIVEMQIWRLIFARRGSKALGVPAENGCH